MNEIFYNKQFLEYRYDFLNELENDPKQDIDQGSRTRQGYLL